MRAPNVVCLRFTKPALDLIPFFHSHLPAPSLAQASPWYSTIESTSYQLQLCTRGHAAFMPLGGKGRAWLLERWFSG